MWAEQEDTAVVTHAQDTEDYYGAQATANSTEDYYGDQATANSPL